jgi:hypothetical protein
VLRRFVHRRRAQPEAARQRHGCRPVDRGAARPHRLPSQLAHLHTPSLVDAAAAPPQVLYLAASAMDGDPTVAGSFFSYRDGAPALASMRVERPPAAGGLGPRATRQPTQLSLMEVRDCRCNLCPSPPALCVQRAPCSLAVGSLRLCGGSSQRAATTTPHRRNPPPISAARSLFRWATPCC